MKIKEHLKELMNLLKPVLFTYIIITAITICFYQQIISLYISYIGIKIYAFSPIEEMQVGLNVSMIIGLILSLPILIRQILIYSEVKNKIILISLSSFSLLLVSFLIGFTIITKSFLESLNTMTITTQMWSLSSIISISIMLGLGMVIATSLLFIIPLLVKYNLITSKQLTKNLFTCIVIMYFIVAWFTPTDLTGNFIILFPMIIMFAVGILISKIIEWRKVKC